MSAARAVARASAAWLVAAALALAPRDAVAQAGDVRAQATITPSIAKLGERMIYRGAVSVPSGSAYKWLPIEHGEDFTWGAPRARRVSGQPGMDTMAVEVSLAVFRSGDVSVPGLRLQRQDRADPAILRLPTVRVHIASVLAAADSNADLRPARGPLAAPWWERVPWRWVVLALAILALAIWLWRALQRRKPAAPPIAAPALDPAATALAELAALRALDLPGRGRFAEHAFHLSHILRRYLEATIGATRPGHTTSELIARLESTQGLASDDLATLSSLLRVWDRVKFARAAATEHEARRAEVSVEALVRRRSAKPAAEAA